MSRIKTERIIYQLMGDLYSAEGKIDLNYSKDYAVFNFMGKAKQKDSLRLVYLPIGYVYPVKFSALFEALEYSKRHPIEATLSCRDRISLRNSFIKIKKENMMDNNIVVIMGMSASGKDTLLMKLIKDKNFDKIITFTTRPKRFKEQDGKDYHFITNEQFEAMIENDELVEYRKYITKFNNKKATWYYGLHKLINNITGKRANVLITTPTALKSIYKEFGYSNVKVVYLDVDENVRMERAIGRGDFSLPEWERREKSDKKIFERWLKDNKPDLILTQDQTLEEQIKRIKALILKY